MVAANRISQRLSYSSTPRNAGGLNFRVRDGYGWNPAAVAALTPTRGIEPREGSALATSVGTADAYSVSETTYTCDPVCAWTRFTESMR